MTGPRLPLVLAVILLAVFPASADPQDSCDGHNDAGSGRDGTSAAPIPVEPGTYAGCIGPFDARQDWYQIEAGPGERVAVTFTWTDCEAVTVTMFRVLADGSREQHGMFLASRGCPGWTLNTNHHAETTTYVAMIELRSAVGQDGLYDPYTVEVQRGVYLAATCRPADDLGAGRDAEIFNPLPVTPGAPRGDGCVDHVDDIDAYRVVMDRPGPIHVDAEVTGECDYFQVTFYNEDHGENFENLTHLDAAESWECRDLRAVFDVREPGRFLVLVSALKWKQPHHVEYGLRIQAHQFETLCGGQDDHGSGRDSSWADPVPAAVGAPIHGCLDEADADDAYTVPVTAGAYALTIEAEGCRQPFTGVDQDGDGRAPYHAKFDCRTGTDHYRANADETWTLLLGVDERAAEWMGAYTLTLRRCEGAPPLLPASLACALTDLVEPPPAIAGSTARPPWPCRAAGDGALAERACPLPRDSLRS